MTQALMEVPPKHQVPSPLVGNLEAPRISQLGSLDNTQEANELPVDTERPSTIHGIIYNGV